MSKKGGLMYQGELMSYWELMYQGYVSLTYQGELIPRGT